MDVGFVILCTRAVCQVGNNDLDWEVRNGEEIIENINKIIKEFLTMLI